MRIAETNEILKRPVNKLFPIEYTYHNNNQTDKAREPNLRWEAAVIRELKRKYECSPPSFHWKVGWEHSYFLFTLRITAGSHLKSFSITNINLLIRCDKALEIFPSVTRVLSVLLITAATSANLERANHKERVPKVPVSSPAASYVHRWEFWSNSATNV